MFLLRRQTHWQRSDSYPITIWTGSLAPCRVNPAFVVSFLELCKDKYLFIEQIQPLWKHNNPKIGGEKQNSPTIYGHWHTITNEACDTLCTAASWASRLQSEVSRRPEDGGPIQLLGFTVSTFPNSRRRQDSQRAVSCFIKDHSTSNYRVTTVWLRDRELQRGEKNEP